MSKPRQCEKLGCGERAAWDWTPRMMYLCDKHAAGLDQDDLEDLSGVEYA